MFHRFRLDGDELVAVGVVMPNGVCHVEWLEQDAVEWSVDENETYEAGIAQFIKRIFDKEFEFRWVDNPMSGINKKVATDWDDVKQEIEP